MTASIYHWGSVDRDPEQTKRKVLAALASHGSMTIRQTQGVALGTDKFGRAQTRQALLWLCDHGLVESAYNPKTGSGYGKYRITVFGRLSLDWIAATEQSA